MMFSHPYAPLVEQVSDESTRMNSNRLAVLSSATMQGRANHEKIGGVEESSSCHQEKEPQSLTQSLFSALGNLVSGGSVNAKAPISKSARGVSKPEPSQTFTSTASRAKFLTNSCQAERDNQLILGNKGSPLIHI